jgi:hypothetical protein
MTTAARLIYATETCTRCGGSGTYSRCQMHGTDCFKCVVAGNPRGIQQTDAAVKARKAIADFRAEILAVDADALKVGDVINATSARTGTAAWGKACKLTIREIGAPYVVGFQSKAADTRRDLSFAQIVAGIEAGEIEGTIYRAVQVRGDKQRIIINVGTRLQRMPTADDLEKIFAFAGTLDGVSVVRA